MPKTVRNKFILIALAIIVVAGVLLPQFKALATKDTLGGGLGLPSVEQAQGSEDLARVMAENNALNLGVWGEAIVWVADRFSTIFLKETQDWAFQFGFITNGWTLVRNMVNTFFVIFLIIIAFGTIFDIPRYTYRDLLPRFLIAALLVNFSITIAGYVINISNGLAQIMLNQIEGGATTLSQLLAEGAKIQSTIPNNEFSIWNFKALAQFLTGNAMQLALDGISTFVFLIGFLFALIVVMIFIIMRIPVLWILIIFSPVAFASYILPNTRRIWSSWWQHLINWSFFLPVYMFILVLTAGFIVNKSALSLPQNSSTTGFLLGAGSTLDTLLYFLLTNFMIVGGLWASFKVSSSFGKGVNSAFSRAQSIAVGAGRRIPIIGTGTNVGAVIDATRETGRRIGQEGFRIGGRQIYGGAAGQKEKQERAAGYFQRSLGLQQPIDVQKKFVTDSNKTYDGIKANYDAGNIDIDKIREEANKYAASSESGFAYRKFMAETGHLDDTTFTNTLDALKDKPYAAGEFIKAGVKSDFTGVREDVLFNKAGDLNTPLPARREIYKFVQDKDSLISKIDSTNYNKAIDILGSGTYEGKQFTKKVGRIKPHMVAEQEGLTGTAKVNKIKELLQKEGADHLGSLPVDVWNDHEFQQFIMDKYFGLSSSKAKGSFRDKMEESIISSKDSGRKQFILNSII
ncbi:MAG: hypothetical protein COV29_04535 [Candidatus Yanofskybacteria bacterium CG10_big_fil_rev_8_21_14_0_10_36_16]|uniref:Uncharacterized protein n=1 Tax=Candidatus Yanofskybacteria bacterium CG10_big_fil_rev_8_21_14_0_10_36_16 TaxID=1975096 RepID=A0A2J0Q6H6_9BACT|nr:MAG: hypothetical protein COV29_04535 [Candidatus Yanofskybacteria bacterium CG10_big_fil_rev_8_21_14_0_10_36_16]